MDAADTGMDAVAALDHSDREGNYPMNVMIEEPPARKPKGRNRQWKQPRHLYMHGQFHTFHSRAELLAYISSMRKRK